MFKITKMLDQDCVELVTLWHEGWHEAHAHLVPPEILKFRSQESFNIWLQHTDEEFFVARGDNLAGFVSISCDEVVKLYVSKFYRGGEVARSLLVFAEQQILKSGYGSAKLFCVAGNQRAERFYLREGWSLIDTFPDRLWVPVDIALEIAVQTHLFSHKFKPTLRDF